MTISELNPGQGNVDVEGTIIEIGEPRTFNKFGRELKVANAILQDDSELNYLFGMMMLKNTKKEIKLK